MSFEKRLFSGQNIFAQFIVTLLNITEMLLQFFAITFNTPSHAKRILPLVLNYPILKSDNTQVGL